MTEDAARAENMHLRTLLTALQGEQARLQHERDDLVALQARTEARLAEVLGSSTWRLSLRLVDAAERIPGPVRRTVAATRRLLRSAPPPEPPEPPPATPPVHALPDHARFYGLFTQDDASLAATPWYDARAPLVSVIILNWNRSAMTLACVRYVLRHTAGHSFEVIVADNGSAPADLDTLQACSLPMRVLPLGRNLYFGEANNIAAEQARGEYLVFLNNDAFVHDGWLAPLVAAMQTVPHAAAAGSQLRYPDGTLQEAGSLVSPDGTTNQIGKTADPADERFNALRLVDYVSAAAMLTRRADFLAVLGFDLCYEPAYYEDVDLCMKLRAGGGAIVYCPRSVVTHVENVTSLDGRLSLGLQPLILANRAIFAARWGGFLLGHAPDAAPVPPFHPPPSHPGATGRRRVALYASGMLKRGSGERALLAAGQALAQAADVTLVTGAPCSAIRLRRLGLNLDVDVSQIALASAGQAQSGPVFDAAFVLAGAKLPPAGLARTVTCLSPGPADAPPGVRSVVIAPPVPRRRAGPKLRRILSVGRFAAGEQLDRLVEAFRGLIAEGGLCELDLAGVLPSEPEHRACHTALLEQAKQLPITIHANPAPAALDALYARAMVFWQVGTADPFGTEVAEAMSAGCVPVVLGPAGIVRDGQDGYQVGDAAGLVARTRTLLDDGALRSAIAARAVIASAGQGEAGFAGLLRALVAEDAPPVPTG